MYNYPGKCLENVHSFGSINTPMGNASNIRYRNEFCFSSFHLAHCKYFATPTQNNRQQIPFFIACFFYILINLFLFLRFLSGQQVVNHQHKNERKEIEKERDVKNSNERQTNEDEIFLWFEMHEVIMMMMQRWWKQNEPIDPLQSHSITVFCLISANKNWKVPQYSTMQWYGIIQFFLKI